MADYGFLRFFSSENIICRLFLIPNHFFTGGFMSTAGRFTRLAVRLLPPPLVLSQMLLQAQKLTYLIFMELNKNSRHQ
jgi:hypothetical protein